MKSPRLFLSILIFFPSVTFGLINAEVFPWALLFTIYKLKRINIYFLFIFALFFSSFIFTTYMYGLAYLVESFRSIFAYINPLLMFLFLMSLDIKNITKLIIILRYVLLVMLIFGILQSIGLISFLDPLFKFMIPRGGATEFGGGRGVMLFSTEPSRAAYEIIFIYATFRLSKIINGTLINIVMDILFSLYLLLIIKSAVGFSILLLYFVIIYRLKLIFVLFLAIPLLISFFVDNRAISVLFQILSSTSLDEVHKLIVNASGFRLVSVISAYYYGLSNLFGGGVGAWAISSINSMIAAGFSANELHYFISEANAEFIGVRPTSYAANFALDFGLIGIFSLAYLILPYIKRAWSCGREIKPIVIIFLFSLLFYGEVGNPIPWLCFALSIRYLEDKINIINKNYL
jgi:hypothetical protein